MRKAVVVIGVCLAAVAVGAPGAGAAAGSKPHIINFQYSQDYEGIGRHYSVGAIVKGEAKSVQARLGSLKTETRLAGHISPAGHAKYWIIDDHDFVSALRDELKATGGAVVTVKAVGSGGAVRKRCSLTYQPDPDFGDYADGPCKKL
jgi:hypothetical protein